MGPFTQTPIKEMPEIFWSHVPLLLDLARERGAVRLHEVALRRCYNVKSFEILTVVNIL
jgi:hypothetical protein